MEIEKKEEPKKDKSPRFIHFGWYGQMMGKGKLKHNGVLTVAYRQTDSALRVGFVFCSPSDNFSRKEGRNESLRHMRNYPIILPMRTDKFNRDLILELVNYLCGIGPRGKTWDIPEEAVYNHTIICGLETATSRIPGWAKKWWINIAVNGSQMGRSQTHIKYEEAEDPWNSVKYVGGCVKVPNIFDMPMGQFFKQAQEAGIAVDIMLG